MRGYRVQSVVTQVATQKNSETYACFTRNLVCMNSLFPLRMPQPVKLTLPPPCHM